MNWYKIILASGLRMSDYDKQWITYLATPKNRGGEGKGITEISELSGFSRKAVRNFLKKNNLWIPGGATAPFSPSQKDIENIIHLITPVEQGGRGESLGYIANIYNIDISTLSKFCKNNGIDFPSREEQLVSPATNEKRRKSMLRYMEEHPEHLEWLHERRWGDTNFWEWLSAFPEDKQKQILNAINAKRNDKRKQTELLPQ